MLRARIRLANYKVRTGQVEVPFDQLQVLPVPCGHENCTVCPGRRARQEASASSSRGEGSAARDMSINAPSAARLQRVAEMSLARNLYLEESSDDNDELIRLPPQHTQTDSEDSDEMIVTLPPQPARKRMESASPNTPHR